MQWTQMGALAAAPSKVDTSCSQRCSVPPNQRKQFRPSYPRTLADFEGPLRLAPPLSEWPTISTTNPNLPQAWLLVSLMVLVFLRHSTHCKSSSVAQD
jgi:hypothetical protein